MELKTYSVIINWHDRDREQGTYAATVRAPDYEEAEAIVRQMMRATGEGSWPFGTCVECSEGAAWAAADLEKALREVEAVMARFVLPKPDADYDHPWRILERARGALRRCEPDAEPWGSLHYDGGEEPDWTRFAYLEIDGVAIVLEDDPEDRTINGGKPDSEAEFWTIYGREKDTGIAQALQDCVTRHDADHVLRLMMERSGLPGYRVGEPMPEEIKGVIFPHDREDCDGEHSAALLDDPLATWRYEVANGDTKLGFEEWQEHQREMNAA